MKEFDAISSELGGHEKPKKEVHEIHVRKAHTGGYIAKHHHTHPEHHPAEEHVIHNQDHLVDHMLEHMGTPNPGEAEAEAGQSGIPAPGGPPGPAGPAPAMGGQ